MNEVLNKGRAALIDSGTSPPFRQSSLTDGGPFAKSLHRTPRGRTALLFAMPFKGQPPRPPEAESGDRWRCRRFRLERFTSGSREFGLKWISTTQERKRVNSRPRNVAEALAFFDRLDQRQEFELTTRRESSSGSPWSLTTDGADNADGAIK